MSSVGLIIHPYTANKELGLGHDRYAYELLKYFPSLGIEAKVYESGFLTSIAQTFPAELKMIRRLSKSSPLPLYHATATLNAQCALSAGKSPLITTIHDVLWFFVKSRYASPAKWILKTTAIKRAAKKSDGIIVPFSSTGKFLENELGVKPERIVHIPLGVDHETFRPEQTGEKLAPLPYFPTGKPTVLFVGAVNRAKGIDSLIRSFDAVVSKVRDAQLIIGSGQCPQDIRDLAEKSSVKNHIHFVGFIPESELRRAYVQATVTAFPSRYGFGLSVLESMACGTPVVAGRTLDSPEFIEDAGLLANPDDAEEIGHQLIRILSDSNFRQELQKKGLAKSQQYQWEKTAQMTVGFYKKLAPNLEGNLNYDFKYSSLSPLPR